MTRVMNTTNVLSLELIIQEALAQFVVKETGVYGLFFHPIQRQLIYYTWVQFGQYFQHSKLDSFIWVTVLAYQLHVVQFHVFRVIDVLEQVLQCMCIHSGFGFGYSESGPALYFYSEALEYFLEGVRGTFDELIYELFWNVVAVVKNAHIWESIWGLEVLTGSLNVEIVGIFSQLAKQIVDLSLHHYLI